MFPFGGDDQTDPFLERAARWAVDLRYRDLPPAVRRAAGAQRLGALGAAVWTTTLPVGGRLVRAVIEEDGSDGEATLLAPKVGSVAPRTAAAAHTALGTALEFDDSVLGGPPGHSAVFVPLAYAEASGASWDRALVAHVAANEIASRVVCASAPDALGGEQSGYAHALRATVGRSLVEGDDAATLADAMAIALTHPPWPLDAGRFGGDAEPLSAAEPVRSGLTAVRAAREGIDGNHDLVAAEGGLLESFTDRPLPAFLSGFPERTRPRGPREGRWHTRAMTVKAHPGAASVAAPVEAALDARRELADETVPVSHVTVDAPRFTTRLDDRASRYVRGPDSSLAALSGSVAYNVAVALLDGEHTPRQFAPARRGSREVWELAERVTVRADGALTEAAFDTAVPFGLMRSQLGLGVLPYTARTLGARGTLKRLPAVLRSVRKRPLPTDLAAAERRLGAHVTLHLEDGRSVTAECPHPQGFAGRPLAETRAVARGRLLDALTERAGEGTSVGPVVDDLREPEGSVSLAPVAELLERGPTATPAAMGRREHP